jgi:hypothetical protein
MPDADSLGVRSPSQTLNIGGVQGQSAYRPESGQTLTKLPFLQELHDKAIALWETSAGLSFGSAL